MVENSAETRYVGTYQIAGISIEIHSVFSDVQALCASYRSNNPAESAVFCTREDIEYQRNRFIQFGLLADKQDQKFSDEDLEIIRTNLKIAEIMLEHGVLLFHGSAVAVDGECYIFTARSGTGKSTHTALWRELLGEKAIMVNDDKPYIRVNENGEAIVYGTPWNGKHRLSTNIAVPLKAICLLERADENIIREIPRSEALMFLIRHTYLPPKPDAKAKSIILLNRMNVRYYQLGCNMDISAAKLSYNTMKG